MPDETTEAIAALQKAACVHALTQPEPDWAPLEAALPRQWWAAWMYFGQDESPAGGQLVCYKHGISRKCLHLQLRRGELLCWRFDGRGTTPATTYLRADLETEIARAYADIDAGLLSDFAADPGTKATRESGYGPDFRARRDACLARAGIRSVTLGPTPPEEA